MKTKWITCNRFVRLIVSDPFYIKVPEQLTRFPITSPPTRRLNLLPFDALQFRNAFFLPPHVSPSRDEQGGLCAIPGSHSRHGGRCAGVDPAGEDQHRVPPGVPPHLRVAETQVSRKGRGGFVGYRLLSFVHSHSACQ